MRKRFAVLCGLGLAAALAAEPAAQTFFDGISYSNKRWHVLSIDGAKTAETRQRRIDKSITMLREGRALEADIRVPPDFTAPTSGFRLRLTGRIGRVPGGEGQAQGQTLGSHDREAGHHEPR